MFGNQAGGDISSEFEDGFIFVVMKEFSLA